MLRSGVFDMLMPQSSARPMVDETFNEPLGMLQKMLRMEWLGQTLASTCWIVSVFVYGISSPGDWLQLAAASSWLVANLASLFSEN